MSRYIVITNGDDTLAWDDADKKMYQYHCDADLAIILKSNLQMYLKFSPYAEISETDERPDWLPK